jgi:hypothetical protein
MEILAINSTNALYRWCVTPKSTDFAHQTLEGQLANEQFSGLLVPGAEIIIKKKKTFYNYYS